jgi:hypothetical protein
LERSNVSNAAKHAAALAEDSDASIELAGETDDDEDNVGLSRSMGSVGSINSSPGSAKGRVSGVGALGTALTGSSAVAKPRSAFALAAESDDEDDGTVLGPVRAAKSATAPAKRHAGPPDTAPKRPRSKSRGAKSTLAATRGRRGSRSPEEGCGSRST